MHKKYSDFLLVQKYIPVLKQHEGCILHPYLDTKGFLTTGYGYNISQKKDFLLFNWQINHLPLAPCEKNTLWDSLQTKKEILLKKWKIPLVANKQTPLKVCFITYEEALQKAFDYLYSIALPTIKQKCLNIQVPFNSLKQNLQLVLLDMEYNMGGNFQLGTCKNNSKKVWINLSKALINQQWEKIPFEIHRKHVSKKRNEWAFQILSNKAFFTG